MTIDSARLALPFLETGQAQKEWTHNEALALLDIAVQATVEGVADSPPASPAAGACWIVGGTPSGAWAGRAGSVAGWTAGGWRFVGAREGMSAWSLAEDTIVRYRNGAWSLDRVPPITAPSGGTTIDAECRSAVAAILAALQIRGWLA
jgi:hypothetical protein